MKVLFAVSNEEISEAVVKKYQSEYKQIISYKNVYYFNAILKEIQKDKTYDRIVISEDLESFSHTQYDQIDKFIFDKLDSISDEASSVRGEDIPVIVICSDRRTKSEQMLVKMFGIGIYNAILGTDRSVDEVCKLVNQPRTKKEAKQYYKIESDEVSYQSESENDVSEVEIQNILTHYKKLGKDENKYIECFNNIAAQYNDMQLRIISKFLPLNIRAVLEEKSPKYQQIMTFNNSVSNNLRQNKDQNVSEGPSSTLLKTSNRDMPMSKPVVIPSSVNMNNVVKLGKTKKVINNQMPENIEQHKFVQPQQQPVQQPKVVQPQTPVVPQQVQQPVQPQIQQSQPQQVQPQPIVNENVNSENTSNDVIAQQIQDLEDLMVATPVKKGRGRPRKNPVEQQDDNKPKKRRGRPPKNSEQEVSSNNDVLNQTTQIDNVLPGFEDFEVNSYGNESASNQASQNFATDAKPQEVPATLPGFEDLDDLEDIVNQNNQQSVNNNIQNTTQEDTTILPGFEDLDTNKDYNTHITTNQNVDNYSNEEENILPGFDSYNNNYEKQEQPEETTYNQPQPQYSDNSQSGYVFEDSNLEDSINQFSNNSNSNFNDNYNNTNISNDNISMNNDYKQPEEDYYAPVQETKRKEYVNTIDLSNLLTPDKKVVSFLGTSKNGTSFIVNNVAELMSSMGISVAILDTTSNRNSYYIYTKNEEELRTTSSFTLDNLVRGNAQGIQVNKNLAVYTSLPDENDKIEQVDEILETLIKNYSLVLIDTDFDTPVGYFKQSQEIYLVQSLDILTIQPLTAFLRELKAKNILEESKLRIIINKAVKVKGISEKTIIGGMAFYNDPAMSFMTELFDRNMVKYITIPFEVETYTRYLENVINCEVNLKGYSKVFMQSLKELANMIYPLISGGNKYMPPSAKANEAGGFAPSINDTLEQMKKNY